MMTSVKYLFLFIILCLGACPGLKVWAVAGEAESSSSLLFVTSPYEPYVIDDEGRASGIFPDIVRAAFRGTHIRPEFQFVPWLRGEHEVQAGKAFGTFPYLKTKARVETFGFSGPIIYFFPKFFYNRSRFPDGFEWQTLADFKGYQMGGVRGYWYEQDFKNAGLTTSYVTSDRQNIEMLRIKRIDFTLIDELVGWNLIRRTAPSYIGSYAVAAKAESSSAFHLMISPDYPGGDKLTQQLNMGLGRIQQNGEYQEILERYHVPADYSVVPSLKER